MGTRGAVWPGTETFFAEDFHQDMCLQIPQPVGGRPGQAEAHKGSHTCPSRKCKGSGRRQRAHLQNAAVQWQLSSRQGEEYPTLKMHRAFREDLGAQLQRRLG